MPRAISDESRQRVYALHEQRPESIGLALGTVVLKTNVPFKAVAELLTASEATVYRWAYGEVEPRPVYHQHIKRLVTILKRALRAGDAPLSGTHTQRMAAVSDLIIKHKEKPVRLG